MHLTWIARVALLVALGACGSGGAAGDDDDGDDDDDDRAGLYDPAIATVVIEVDYATGAEPYTGEVAAFGDLWGLFETNLDRLFLDAGKTIESPRALDDMEAIGDVDAGPYTVADLLEIADAHRDLLPDASTASFYVLFVDDYFDDGTGAQTGILGVSIGNTGVIAMFKPVIESTGNVLLPSIERFVEQTTLIHEIGHGVGLVNNGIPLAAEHQDTDHGKHCTDDTCIMFWLNEGASDAVEFARDHVTGGDAILFGDECLADVDALIAASGG